MYLPTISNLNLSCSSPSLLFLVFSMSSGDDKQFLPPSSIFGSLKVVVIDMICGHFKVVLKLAYFARPNCRHREGAARGM